MNKKSMLTLTLIGLFSWLFAIGCATASTEANASPDGSWTLNELVVDGENIEIPEGVVAQMTLNQGEVNGTAGCNNFFGSAEIDGDAISFGPLGATRMACPEPIMNVEFGLFSALEQAEIVSVDSDTLQMKNSDGTTSVSFQRVTESS